MFYDRLQSLERLKEVAQRSGGKRREFLPVSPHGAGDRHCSSTSGDCAVVLSRAQRWQDHIRECTEGANPWVPGFPAPKRNKPTIWVCKRNRGLLDLKNLLRLGQQGHRAHPDALKVQGPSFSKHHIILLGSYMTLRKGPGPSLD